MRRLCCCETARKGAGQCHAAPPSPSRRPPLTHTHPHVRITPAEAGIGRCHEHYRQVSGRLAADQTCHQRLPAQT